MAVLFLLHVTDRCGEGVERQKAARPRRAGPVMLAGRVISNRRCTDDLLPLRSSDVGLWQLQTARR